MAVQQSALPANVQIHQRKLMLFELDTRGHHPGYVQHLIKYWCQNNLPGHLDVVVTPKFAELHTNIINLAANSHCESVRFVTIANQEEAQLVDSEKLGNSFKGRILRAFQEWSLLRQYATQLGTTHSLLMYLDTMLARHLFGGRFPSQFSCIYFRPVFHYSKFPNFSPTRTEKIWQWRDRVCLPQLLRSPSLNTLFCLDPFAIHDLNQLTNRTPAVYLPDPVQVYNHAEDEIQQLRQSLNIEAGRKVFLLFGVLSERKGIYQVLSAVAKLPPETCQKLCLLFVGPIDKQEKEQVEQQIKQLQASLPVQIICCHQFVPDEAVQPYFQIADVVLAPYQRHIGMSAILVRAAAARKPVLSSDFGLMGEMTRRYELGVAVNSTNVDAVAKTIFSLLTNEAIEHCNLEKMRQFADRNNPQAFATEIFQHLT